VDADQASLAICGRPGSVGGFARHQLWWSLLVIQGRHYQLALDSDFDASIWARPHESIGFVPEFADPRVHVVESAFDRPDSPRVSRRTREAIRGVDRVIIYGCSNIFICPFLSSHGDVLRGEGFQESEIFDFGTEIVLIWQRSP
jgi:hypothetical protein